MSDLHLPPLIDRELNPKRLFARYALACESSNHRLIESPNHRITESPTGLGDVSALYRATFVIKSFGGFWIHCELRLAT